MAALTDSVSLTTMARNPVKYFMVDAFADSAFKGNPAAICLMEQERDDEWLQSLAAEFNSPMTGYLTRITESESDDSLHGNSTPKFRLRWFTPVAEVEICGHATMAAAHVLFTRGLVDSNENVVEFATRVGILTAKRKDGNMIELDFPVISLNEVNSAAISNAVNLASILDIKMTSSKSLLVVLGSAKDVVDFEPNYDEMRKCPGIGIIITGISSADSEFDFHSRVFFPKLGINEDPVCGSAHCALAGYWAHKLGKSRLLAYAASPRGGILEIHLDKATQRVMLRGKAITMMEGLILV